ncbi:hypothetical protein [Synechococcus sp. RedBA-s]|uniref:hypothetical protein n=1 Tax=Synechococcus sp. RedBA-s TaxID=2823741 RepID=UPI0020CD323B|nr:hypothetical protein [Synechococcus sp. RedBA-s]MCP9799691.1 hypothetical protein [Synechococcus sp. RedBA-s]
MTTISQFQSLFSQNQRSLIQSLMCHFAVDFYTIALEQPLEAKRQFASEWADLQILEADGLVRLAANSLEVTDVGRWLIRTIATVFDPSQRRQSSGSRLI